MKVRSSPLTGENLAWCMTYRTRCYFERARAIALLNGEYLTTSDVRRKDKELRKKKKKADNNKEEANYKGAEEGEPGSRLILI